MKEMSSLVHLSSSLPLFNGFTLAYKKIALVSSTSDVH